MLLLHVVIATNFWTRDIADIDILCNEIFFFFPHSVCFVKPRPLITSNKQNSSFPLCKDYC